MKLTGKRMAVYIALEAVTTGAVFITGAVLADDRQLFIPGLIIFMVMAGYGSWRELRHLRDLGGLADKTARERDRAYAVAGLCRHCHRAARKALHSDPQVSARYHAAYEAAWQEWASMDPERRDIAARLLTITASSGRLEHA